MSFQQSQVILYALNGLIVDNRFKLYYITYFDYITAGASKKLYVLRLLKRAGEQ